MHPNQTKVFLFILILIPLYKCFLNEDPFDAQEFSELLRPERGSDKPSKNWALLVTGMRGVPGSYFSQANALHAYHTLKNYGIPEENIIVITMNDIAYNFENRIQGVVVSRNGGPDVYNGVKFDYTRWDVNASTILHVMQGNPNFTHSGSGRVIESGPEDNIFVYITDHGGYDAVELVLDELLADDLNDAILNMYENKRYKNMLIYIDACQSGGMFYRTLRNDIRVLGITGSRHLEKQRLCFLWKASHADLNSEFSVAWLEYADKNDISQLTVMEHFEILRARVNYSRVMMYGDLSVASLKVGDFMGPKPVRLYSYPDSVCTLPWDR